MRRRRDRGFTLVELTVALVAGLVIAMAMVGLSKSATRTFNEEMRSSAAEAALRTAMDRLRADLERASYMSTGNIATDPQLALALGNTFATQFPSAPAGIKQLGAAQIMTTATTPAVQSLTLSGLQTPALAPQGILIAGNMTGAEQFPVEQILPAGSGADCGACTEISLSKTAPAIYRAAPAQFASPPATAGTGAQELDNLFVPLKGADATNQFIVRLVDNTAHTQFLATCKNTPVAGFSAATSNPFVCVDTTVTPIVQASSTGGSSGVSGYCGGCLLNPVQVVRWEIVTAASEQKNQPQFQPLGYQPLGYTTQTLDTLKYDLIRSYVDAAGTVLNGTSEIIAEYAVDLEFAVTVDNTTIGPSAPSYVSYAFNDTGNNDTNWACNTSAAACDKPNGPGPQRIRSVRALVATRAAQADRSSFINVTPGLSTYTPETFLYRYCLNTNGCTYDGTDQWARVRTATTEVALVNNANFFY